MTLLTLAPQGAETVRPEIAAGSSGTQKKSVLVVIALLVAFAWGSFLRVRNLDAQSFWIDEAFSWCHAHAIVEHGKPLLTTGAESWIYPVPHYLMAASLALGDGDPADARLFPALAGGLMILVLFELCRRLTGSVAQALIAAMVLAVMTFEIAWSRQARYYSILQLTTGLACIAVLAYRATPTIARAVLLLLALIAALLSHPSGIMAAVFAALLWTLDRGLTARRRAGIVIAVLVTLGVGLLLPADTNPLRKMIGGITPFKPERATNYLNAVIGQFEWSCALIAAGLLLAFIKRHAAMMAIALVVFLYAIYLCFLSPLSHLRYIVPLLPFLVVLGVFGAGEIVARVHQAWSLAPAIAVAVAIGLTLRTADISLKPFDVYYLGATAPQPDWRAAYRWIAADSAGVAPRIVSNFPEMQEAYAPSSERFFLPVNLTGRAADIRMKPSYSAATPVTSLPALGSIGEGYLIVDDLGMMRSGPEEIRRLLERRRPVHIVAGPYRVYIWRLRDLVKGPGQRS